MSFNPTRRQKRNAKGKGMIGGRFVRMDGAATKAPLDKAGKRAAGKRAAASRKRNR